MDQMKRFAIYYAPRDGAFADAAAAWLGWDARLGNEVAQPDVPNIAALTTEPRKYGFHGTIKPPFRLAGRVGLPDLCNAAKQLAANLRVARMPGLRLADLHGFMALVPEGDTTALQTLAADVVRGLDHFRAPLTEAEIARRRPETLTPRQRELLSLYGYPHVMEEFQFHLTLSGKLNSADAPAQHRAAAQHFAGLLPQPFAVQDLCLFGEALDGRFHLLHRYPLSA